MKNIDWKNVGWRSLQGLIVVILNVASIVWFVIREFVYKDNWVILDDKNGNPVEVNDKGSMWEILGEQEGVWNHQWTIYIFMLIGIGLSVLFIKFLYKEHRQDKRINKQTKEIKDGKDIEKYL